MIYHTLKSLLPFVLTEVRHETAEATTSIPGTLPHTTQARNVTLSEMLVLYTHILDLLKHTINDLTLERFLVHLISPSSAVAAI